MRLKNILLVVDDLEKSTAFYKELFGLMVLKDFGGNVILTEGLVLQERKIWEELIEQCAVYGGNVSELYFVENNLEAFQEKLENCSFEINYVHKLKEYPWGQKAIRIYDPDGHMIEIGETASV
jgi:catechol 2,3-dioxygenase-like lactoylglutathione lyase family enzyme